MVLGFDATSQLSLDEKSFELINKKLLQIFNKSVTETAIEIQKDLESITEHWSSKPKFKFVVDAQRGKYTATLTTDDERWKWLDYGVEPHTIPGSKISKLSFPGYRRNKAGVYDSTYLAATRPNSFESEPSEYLSGDNFAVSQLDIEHPGVEARNWSVLLSQKHRVTFVNNMKKNFALLEF